MNEYNKRINRVMDYIEKNLGEELTLDELADVSCFSRFHFNRIFSVLVGETLFKFIQRLRLEKAATLLCSEKTKSLLEIALDCGYSNAASFSKSFKAYHGVSPSQWKQKSNIGQADSNYGKEFSRHLVDTDLSKNWRYRMDKKNVSVEVKEIQQETVAYVRHTGPYAGNEALFGKLYGQLCQWAGPRDLILDDAKFISIYHDNPEITDEEKLRISICLVVTEGTVGDGDINIMTIPGGKYAIGHFEIDVAEYGDAWSFLCGEWLSSSGYEPDDRPCFEMMMNEPRNHPAGKHIVDIYEPVKAM
jgi:AraC family transcriptional regulator